MNFHELSSDSFPFTIEFFDKNGELLWECTVAEAGVLTIPGFSGRVKRSRLVLANGEEYVEDPATGFDPDAEPPSSSGRGR